LRDSGKSGDGDQPKVPSYIVTFSDMTTLLLTFFVMLLSLSSIQDVSLFRNGRESFVKSLESFGLGLLKGPKIRMHLMENKKRYLIMQPDESYEGRTIDADEEELRRLFAEVDRSMVTRPSPLASGQTGFTVTGIRFGRGSWLLAESAKVFLSEFLQALEARQGGGDLKLYVVGLAADGATAKEQWFVSARRAATVAEFLRGRLPADCGWPVYGWGAGPGRQWIASGSGVSAASHILIAALSEGG